VKGEL